MYWNFPIRQSRPRSQSADFSQFVSHKPNNRSLWREELSQCGRAPLFTGHPGWSVRTHKQPLYYSNWLGKYIFFWQNWVAFKGITCFKWHPSIGAVEFDTSCITQDLPTSQGRRLALPCGDASVFTFIFTHQHLPGRGGWLSEAGS